MTLRMKIFCFLVGLFLGSAFATVSEADQKANSVQKGQDAKNVQTEQKAKSDKADLKGKALSSKEKSKEQSPSGQTELISLFPNGTELGPGWSKKGNVTLSWNGTDKSVAVTIDGSEYNFGWFQRILPKANYSQYAGIYGRFRAPKESKDGRILAILIVHREKSEYYAQELGNCFESRGDWIEFFLPIKSFRASQDATKNMLSANMLHSGDALEISISTKTANSTIEFDRFRLVGQEEAKEMERRFNRLRIERLLKPESELTASIHPRLLLFGSRLERIRAKAKEGGIQQAGYERLIQLADEAMKKINANDPFGKAFAYMKNENLNDHVNRGRFEGVMNPLVIPLETLAAAAVITGQEKYGKHGAKALVNMARRLDVNTPEIEQGFYYTRTFYVRALALGYDWLYSYLTPEERREVKITLFGFVQAIYTDSWTAGWGTHPLNRVWNWDPGLVSCAGLGVLALEGETRAAESAMLVQFRRHLRDYLTFGIDFDGCCHEGPSYISYGIGAGVPFTECLRDCGYDDLFTGTNWRNIAPWLVSELLPNQSGWNNLSDCGHGQVPGCPVYAYTCGRLAELAKSDPVRPNEKMLPKADTKSGLKYVQHFSEIPGEKQLSYGAMAELMGWCWNQGSNARNPSAFSDAAALAFVLFYEECPVAKDPGRYLPDSLFFRGRGLVVSRSGGYGKNAFHLAVEAGPHAAGHDQGDKGSFTFRAYGADLVIDSGYGNDGFKEKSGSSFAHNIVLIDGQGQPISWHNDSNGEITGYRHNKTFDWIRADARAAWNFSLRRWQEEPNGMEVEKADRHYLFVRGNGNEVPPYLVTYDDFRKKDGLEHEYTWQWHLSPEFQFKVENDRWIAEQNLSGYPVLTTAANRFSGQAVFELTATQDGVYNIIGLTRCAGQDRGKSDSFFISFNGGPKQCWDLAGSAGFAWSIVKDREKQEYTEFKLAKGEKIRCELTAREPEAQLAFLGLNPVGKNYPQIPTNGKLINKMTLSANEAKNDAKKPFLLQSSQTSRSETNMTVFPVTTPNGKTELTWFETSQEGIHPRLIHTVKATEPEFLMLLVPRPDRVQPLPTVRPLRQSRRIGMEIRWPNGWIDKLLFRPGENGKIPEFQRSQNGSVVTRE